MIYPLHPGRKSNQHLPNELWLQIISHLAEEPRFHPSGTSNIAAINDLASLRLVSRGMCSLVTPTLFRDVELDFSRKYTTNPPADTSRASIRQIRGLFADVGHRSSGPEFLGHAVHLHVMAVYDACRELSFREFAQKWLPLLLDSMPKLRKVSIIANTFYVEHCDVDAVLECVAWRKPWVDVGYEMRSCTANPVYSFPSVANLTKLTVWSYGEVGDVIVKSLRGCPKLRELCLQYVSTPLDRALERILPLEAERLCLERLSLEYCCPPTRVGNLVKLKKLKEVRIGGASPFLAVTEIANEMGFWRRLRDAGMSLEAIESVDWSDELLDYISHRKTLKRLKLPLNRRLQATTEETAVSSESARLGTKFWTTVLPSVQSHLEELSVLPVPELDGELNVHHWRMHREFRLPVPWNIVQDPLPSIASETLRSLECFVDHEEGYFAKLMEVVAACPALVELRCMVLRNLTQRAGAEAALIPPDVKMFENALVEVVRWRAEGRFAVPGGCWMEMRIFSFYNRRQEYWRFTYNAAEARWKRLRMLRVQ